jgi:hypothetical protein
MRPIFLGPEQVAALKAVKAAALANPVPLPALEAMKPEPGQTVPLRRWPESHFIQIPVGLEMGLTYEEQRFGYAWHASFSVNIQGRYPNPVVIDTILELIGLPPLSKAITVQDYGSVINAWWVAAKETQNDIVTTA